MKPRLVNLIEFFRETAPRVSSGSPAIISLDFKKAFDRVVHKRPIFQVSKCIIVKRAAGMGLRLVTISKTEEISVGVGRSCGSGGCADSSTRAGSAHFLRVLAAMLELKDLLGFIRGPWNLSLNSSVREIGRGAPGSGGALVLRLQLKQRFLLKLLKGI